MKEKILIIDDEVSLVKAVKQRLSMENFEIVTFHSAEDAMKKLPAVAPDLLIVDIRLPGMSGFDFCKAVREIQGPQKNIPILFLTTSKSDSDKVYGLNLGGDDYLTKPFNPAELIARVRALLRRTKTPPLAEDVPLSSGGLTVSPDRHEVALNGRILELTPKEFRLLTLFLQKKGRVLTRSFLMEYIWGREYLTTSRTIDTHIKKLRQVLGKTGDKIITIEGLGYKWIG